MKEEIIINDNGVVEIHYEKDGVSYVRYPLNDKTVTVELTNQAIIELAYLTKEELERMMGLPMDPRERLYCRSHCFYICRYLLKQVDPKYLKLHERLVKFFRDGKELNYTDNDSLEWEQDQS